MACMSYPVFTLALVVNTVLIVSMIKQEPASRCKPDSLDGISDKDRSGAQLFSL